GILSQRPAGVRTMDGDRAGSHRTQLHRGAGGLAISFLLFERLLVLGFDFLTSRGHEETATSPEFSPHLGRRAFLLGMLGLLFAGGGAAIARKLFRIATFSYDGTQYKGADVQAITPNNQSYCVTKNVVDPR